MRCCRRCSAMGRRLLDELLVLCDRLFGLAQSQVRTPQNLVRLARSILRRQHDVAEDGPDARTIQLARAAGIFERAARGVEREQEHRIELAHEPGVDVEPIRVEPGVLVDEAAAGRVDLVRRRHGRVVGLAGFKHPASGRHLARGVHRVAHERPEAIQVVRPGKYPTHTDDSDA